MSTNDIILAIFCALLVVYSLVVALVVPKRNPDFPRRLGAFFLVSAVLVGGMLSAVEFFGGEAEPEAAAAEPAEPSAPAETGTSGGEPAVQGDPAAGKELFASEPCGDCHTLADAGTTGAVGPNLDELKPDFDTVVATVTNGRGIMPPFGGQLSEEQIANIAAYVASATAG